MRHEPGNGAVPHRSSWSWPVLMFGGSGFTGLPSHPRVSRRPNPTPPDRRRRCRCEGRRWLPPSVPALVTIPRVMHRNAGRAEWHEPSEPCDLYAALVDRGTEHEHEPGITSRPILSRNAVPHSATPTVQRVRATLLAGPLQPTLHNSSVWEMRRRSWSRLAAGTVQASRSRVHPRSFPIARGRPDALTQRARSGATRGRGDRTPDVGDLGMCTRRHGHMLE
jgi:hypothetical protein